MDSLISNPDSVILNQLFSILNETFQCKGEWRTLLHTMGMGMLKLVASYCIHRLVKNGDVWKVIRFVMLRMVYRKRLLNKENAHDGALLDEFASLTKPAVTKSTTTTEPSDMESVWVSGLPIYMDKEGMNMALYSLPFIHTSFVEQLDEKANAEISEAVVVHSVIRDSAGKDYKPLSLFASNNYINLNNVVHRHFTVCKDTNMVTPPLIVLNGEGGLGKSNSSQFLAEQGKYEEIRHISLISQNMATRSFPSIITEITAKRTPHTTIIYFDELDKYVDSYIQNTYSASRKKQNEEVVVDDSYVVFASETKKSILMAIAGLSDTFTTFPRGVIFIFCSNNFHTLFEGIDSTHVESIKTRFTFINFELCGRDELLRYITTFTERITIPELKYTNEYLIGAFQRVRPNLAITYRDIQKLHSLAAYDVNVFVELVNKEVYNPLISTPPKVYTPNSTLPPQVLQIVPLQVATIPLENSREMREQTKKNMNNIILELLKSASNDDISDGDYYKLFIEKTAGINLVTLAEKSLPEEYVLAADGSLLTENSCILHGVARHGRVEVLEHLIKSGVDVDVEDQQNDELSIAEAIRDVMSTTNIVKREKIKRCVHLLLDAGAVFLSNNAIAYRFIHTQPGLSDPSNERWIIEVLDKVCAIEPIKPTSHTIIGELARSAYSAGLIRYFANQHGLLPDEKGYIYKNASLCRVLAIMEYSKDDYFPVVQALVECGANAKEQYETSLFYYLTICPSLQLVKPVAEYLFAQGAVREYRKYNQIVVKKQQPVIYPEVKAYIDGLIGCE